MYFFVFIVPVKRTTDNLNLRSKICDIASAWLHDLHSRETKSCWKQFWTIIFDFKLCITLQHPNDLAVFLKHSPFNIEIMIYTAQCAAILPHHLRRGMDLISASLNPSWRQVQGHGSARQPQLCKQVGSFWSSCNTYFLMWEPSKVNWRISWGLSQSSSITSSDQTGSTGNRSRTTKPADFGQSGTEILPKEGCAATTHHLNLRAA